MLWEKKIQLAKETREALDPNVGAAEQNALEKDIQRLLAKKTQLKRQQEMITLELERAVHRRESVIVRGTQAIAKNTATAKNIVQKKTSELGKKVKQIRQEIAMAKRDILILFIHSFVYSP